MAVDVWPNGRVQVWNAVTPVVASGPADPRIPFTPNVAEAVLALGYCAPAVGPDRPPANLSASVWRSSAVARPVAIGVVDITPPGIPPGLAGLYTALPGANGSTAWPPGQYVVELDGERADGRPYARWFGIAVRH